MRLPRYAAVTAVEFISVFAVTAGMNVHVKAQCRAGCGDLGDPDLDYLCVKCHGDQIELHQQEELRKYLAKESSATVSVGQESTTSPPSPVKKYRGPRPVDHPKG